MASFQPSSSPSYSVPQLPNPNPHPIPPPSANIPNPNPNSFPPPPAPPKSIEAPPPPPSSAQSSRKKPSVPPRKKSEETEEQRRARKKRELMLRQAQASVLQKTKEALAAKASRGTHKRHSHHRHASTTAESRRAGSGFIDRERSKNPLKKPTSFLCKLRFRNELPDPTAQPKLLTMNISRDRYTKYAITSLDKMHKTKLYPEQDLGIPLDLFDFSVYNTPDDCPPLAPEDKELLHDNDVATTIKHEGIRTKERPTDKGFSWLVKTQYISSISMDATKQTLTEKQTKEMREGKDGDVSLENLNSRERQIQAIRESFETAKLHPVHQSKPSLKPLQIMPLLPDLDRYGDRFVTVAFDSDPTADSEAYNKMERSTRDEHESQAIMRSYVVNGSDSTKTEKFLAYMVPAPDEISKDIYEGNEDISYSWVREYHWDVRSDNADAPTTYLVNFKENEARYLPLPTKLVLQKKKAKEGKSGNQIEHYPVPSIVTVRRRATAAIKELNESGQEEGEKTNRKRRRPTSEDEDHTQHKTQRTDSTEQISGREEV